MPSFFSHFKSKKATDLVKENTPTATTPGAKAATHSSLNAIPQRQKKPEIHVAKISGPAEPPAPVPQTSPSPPKSIWDDAYAKFQVDHKDVLETYEAFLTKSEPSSDEETQIALADVKNSSGFDRVQQVFVTLEKQGKAVRDARWKFKWGEEEIVVQQKVRQIAEKVLKAQTFIGFVASNEPHAALVWAGISTLLPLLTNPALEGDAAIAGLDFTTTLLARYSLLEQRYFSHMGTATQQDQSVQNLLDKAREKMIQIYALVFEYVIRLSITYCKGSFIRLLRDTIKADDWTGLLGGLRTHVNEADKLFEGLDRDVFYKTLKEIEQQQRAGFESVRIDMNLSKLAIATNATYDTSGADNEDPDSKPFCLPGTRRQLLQSIGDWADDSEGSTIFWLHGPAGAGKSTVSRTVAHALERDGRLGASFFFKRGGGDRADSSKLFSTLASQLVQSIGGLEKCIADALDRTQGLGQLAGPKQQFERLLFEPMCETSSLDFKAPTLFIVLDALDECAPMSGFNVVRLVELLAKLADVSSCRFRIFITSRPETKIARIFHMLNTQRPNLSSELDLEDNEDGSIGTDIEAFLRDRFRQIREDSEDFDMPNDWPGDAAIYSLRDMAVPLFIFAATVCRYIQGPGEQRALQEILNGRDRRSFSALNDMYRIILDRLVENPDRRDDLIEELRRVIGSIVLLASPLSKRAAANLLGLRSGEVTQWLSGLSSVLQNPPGNETPVQLYHLSFREFLITKSHGKMKNEFHVDEVETHERLLQRCLVLLNEQWPNKDPVSGWRALGTLRTVVNDDEVASFIRPEVAYACSYWIEHLKGSKQLIHDNDEIHGFLTDHFLHWMEALAWLGRLPTLIGHVGDLLTLVDAKTGTALLTLLEDAGRFVLRNLQVVDLAPLQLYSSALIFTPHASVVRQLFSGHYQSKWPRILPEVAQNWSAELKVLEGHDSLVNAVASSPDGRIIASASTDKTIRLWNAKTGEECHMFRGHEGSIETVAFSPYGRLLASGSWDNTVRIWSLDDSTGGQIQKLEGHEMEVQTVVFSQDGQTLASGSSDKSIRLWNVETGAEMRKLEGHRDGVTALAFSPIDKQMLVSSSWDRTILIWDAGAGKLMRRLDGAHDWRVYALAFSPDGQTLASGSADNTIRMWDIETDKERQRFEGSGTVTSVAFSPDGGVLATGSWDKTVVLWDTKTGKQLRRFEGHDGWVNSVVFSRDGTVLVSASHDKTIRLWQTKGGNEKSSKLEGHSSKIKCIQFSPSGRLLASGSRDKTIRLWNPETGRETIALEGHGKNVNAVSFSPNGAVLASVSGDETVRLWDMKTYQEIFTLKSHCSEVNSVAFSADGHVLASGSDDRMIRLWDVNTGDIIRKLEGHTDLVYMVAFSPTGQLASASVDKTVRIWDTTTGIEMQKLQYDCWVQSVTFLSNGQNIASISQDRIVRVWDLETVTELGRLDDPSEAGFTTFSPDGRMLITRIGLYDLTAGTPRLTSQELTDGSSSSDTSLNGNWVRHRGTDLLWLPQEYRGSQLAVFGNMLAIAQKSGTVSFLQVE